jgi:hypothetical protein
MPIPDSPESLVLVSYTCETDGDGDGDPEDASGVWDASAVE